MFEHFLSLLNLSLNDSCRSFLVYCNVTSSEIISSNSVKPTFSVWSAVILNNEDSIIHIDAVVDPLSSSGQKLSSLLRLLSKYVRASMRLVLNPVVCLFSPPFKCVLFSYFWLFGCHTWATWTLIWRQVSTVLFLCGIYLEFCLLVNFGFQNFDFFRILLQSSLVDLPLKNYYRYVVPTMVSWNHLVSWPSFLSFSPPRF